MWLTNILKLLFCAILSAIYCNVSAEKVINPQYQQSVNSKIQNPAFTTLIMQIPNIKQDIYQSAIIFADDIEDLDEMCKNLILANNYQKNLIFILVFMNANSKNIKSISGPRFLNQETKFISVYSYFISSNGDNYDLISIDWFSKSNCNHPQLVLVNRFSKPKLEWTTDLKYKRKFMNLWNCMITLDTDLSQRLEMSLYDGKVTGLVPQFLRITSVIGNFSLNFQIIHSNGILDESTGKFIHPNIYLRLGSYSKFTLGRVHFGTAFVPSEYPFYVTPGELYTSYEKIFLPFDNLTWCFIFVTFFTTFVVIFIVANFFPRWIQKRIYGKNTKSPALDIVQTFFGISQKKSPVENTPRIVLIFFVFFCLVIRTAYQGVSFEFLTTEMRKKPIDSIEKLVSQNFTIVSQKISGAAIRDNLNSMIGKEKINIILKNDLEIIELYKVNIHNASAKLAFFMQDTFFDILHFRAKGVQGVYLKQILFSYPIGFGTFSNHFMNALVQKTLQLMIPAGVPQHLFKYHHWLNYKRNHIKQKIGPKVLSMNDLLFGFVLWAAACGISIAIFCIELLKHWLDRKFANYFVFITFVNIFKQGLLGSQ